MTDKKATVPAIIEQSVDQVLKNETASPMELMLEGDERGFQTCLKLALMATTSRDWIDMGGNPYLQASGAHKAAFRFGLSIHIDRDPNGRPIFDREDFEDEHGKGAIYTVSGTGQIKERTVEAIGSASTRDQFLGWIGKGDSRKPKPFYDVVEDAKKKAITNMKGNIIKSFLGLDGWTWEMLSNYSIYPEGKASVNYGKGKPAQSKQIAGKKDDRPPFWQWEGNDGGQLISAKSGEHFSEEFLLGIGMKKGGKGIFTSKHSDNKLELLTNQFAEAGKPTEKPKLDADGLPPKPEGDIL